MNIPPLDDTKDTISFTAKPSIPKFGNRKSNHRNIWWNPTLIELKKNRQRARRKWLKQKNAESRAEYNCTNAHF